MQLEATGTNSGWSHVYNARNPSDSRHLGEPAQPSQICCFLLVCTCTERENISPESWC